jgi:hypothetical protein
MMGAGGYYWAAMQLSLEMFNQIIAQLKGNRDGTHDKRREPRVGLRNRVSMSPLMGVNHTPDRTYSINVRDLSRDGIGFLHQRRLIPKTFFTINLPASDEGGLTAVYAVQHCEPLEADLYRIGGSLIHISQAGEAPVSAEVIAQAVAQAEKEAEGRKKQRRGRDADAA